MMMVIMQNNGATSKTRPGRVPDAALRLFCGAPQSRDPIKSIMVGPGSAAHYAATQRRTAQHPGNAAYARFFSRIRSAKRWNR